MPFDFKKFDAECAEMDAAALQREWEHYTRLISGAATSTAVSGMALPLTLGVSSIGIGFAAPAIHNARKKREIVEKHLQRLNATHKTRKRDVLTSVAVSGGVGVFTLGMGSMGASAITNEAIQHSWTHIAENELAVKIGTHLALDGAAVAGEEMHMQSKKTEEAWTAYMKLAALGKVPMPPPGTDFKKPPVGFSTPEDEKVDLKAQQLYTTTSAVVTPPPPPYAERRTSSTSSMYFPPPPGSVRSGSVSTLNPNNTSAAVPTYSAVSPQQPWRSEHKVVSPPSTGNTPLPMMQTEHQQAQSPSYNDQPLPSQTAMSPPIFELPAEPVVVPVNRDRSSIPVHTPSVHSPGEISDLAGSSIASRTTSLHSEYTGSTSATSLDTCITAISPFSVEEQQQQQQQQQKQDQFPFPFVSYVSSSASPYTTFQHVHPQSSTPTPSNHPPTQPVNPDFATSFPPPPTHSKIARPAQQQQAPSPLPPPPPSPLPLSPHQSFQQNLPQPHLSTNYPAYSQDPLPSPSPSQTLRYDPSTYSQQQQQQPPAPPPPPPAPFAASGPALTPTPIQNLAPAPTPGFVADPNAVLNQSLHAATTGLSNMSLSPYPLPSTAANNSWNGNATESRFSGQEGNVNSGMYFPPPPTAAPGSGNGAMPDSSRRKSFGLFGR